MTTENRGETGKREGVNSGLQDWKVQEKTTTVILTRLHGVERVCVSFSTRHNDLEDSDDEDGDDDQDEEDDGGDDDDSMDVDFDDECIKCKLSFYKPRMGVLLITALVNENSFNVRSIAHSPDTRVAKEHTVEMDWEREGLYFGKPRELEGSLLHKFNDYIQTRGINERLASFIMRYVEEKESQEQTKWLQTVETFIRN